MKKMIITMLLASTTILTATSSVSAISSTDNNDIIIENIQSRVQIDEFGISHLVVEKDDNIKNMSVFLDVKENLLDKIEEKLDITLFEEEDKVSYILNSNEKADAILIEKTLYEDDDEHKYIYVDFKSENNTNLCKFIDLDEYEYIVDTWKSTFITDDILMKSELTNEELEGYKNLSPMDEVEWPVKDDEVIVIENKEDNPDLNQGTEESLIEQGEDFSNDKDEVEQVEQSENVENVETVETSEIVETVEDVENTNPIVENNEGIIEKVDDTNSANIVNENSSDEVSDFENIDVDEIIETVEETTSSEELPYEEEVEIVEEIAPEVPEVAEESTSAPTEKDYATVAANNPENVGLQPHVARFKEEVADKYGVTSFSLYRPGDPQDHGKGLAVDFMVPVGSEQGDNISDYSISQMNSGNEQISYVIWEQRIYGDWTGGEGQLMEDRGSITQNHYDHVHVSFY